MLFRPPLILAFIVSLPFIAIAQEDHFHATAAEKAACTADATSFCA